MAQTPEGKVKAKTTKVLKFYNAYYFMPVQNGMGAAGLDYHCALDGKAFFIETKAPGKDATPRQLSLMTKLVMEHNCRTFLVNNWTPRAHWDLICWLDAHARPTTDDRLLCLTECWSDKDLEEFLKLDPV